MPRSLGKFRKIIVAFMQTLKKNERKRTVIYCPLSMYFTTSEILNVNVLFSGKISNTAASKLDESQKILHKLQNLLPITKAYVPILNEVFILLGKVAESRRNVPIR